MEVMVCHTRGGEPWIPKFLEAIDAERCIGCGRCYKVCGRGVMMLVEKPFEGEDEYGDDMGNKVMSVLEPGNCIGCESCAKTCMKKAHTHITL